MIAEGFTCQRYGFNVGADKFSLLTIENGKTSIMRLSEWTLISQSQKSHSDRLLELGSYWRHWSQIINFLLLQIRIPDRANLKLGDPQPECAFLSDADTVFGAPV